MAKLFKFQQAIPTHGDFAPRRALLHRQLQAASWKLPVQHRLRRPKVCSSSACHMTGPHSRLWCSRAHCQHQQHWSQWQSPAASQDQRQRRAMLPRHDAGAHSACSPFCLRGTETAAGRFLPQKGSAGQAALHRCSSSARQAERETTLPYLDSLVACNPS